jgi:hypothetical protein
MNTRTIRRLITGVVISVVGLTMGLGGAAAYAAAPAPKGPVTTVHGSKAHVTSVKHHKGKKHTKKNSHKKHKKSGKKASHKHSKKTSRTHRA